jgi:hypothetical protein
VSSTRLALEKLTKWRAHFAGWQLGTRAKGDPESDAVRDHREVTILLRAEVSALTGLLIRKGVITAEEFDGALRFEANTLEHAYQRRWPGVAATADGLSYDLGEIRRAGWMEGWMP